MLVLPSTSAKLEINLSGAVSTNELPFVASYWDNTTSGATPGTSAGQTNGTSDVDLVAAPGASTQRIIKYIAIYNRDTTDAEVSITYDDGTERILKKWTLSTGATLEYTPDHGWRASNEPSAAADGFNRLSAGTQLAVSAGTVVLSDSHNVTFGMSGSTRITASAPIKISAGASSALLTALTIADSNGIGAGLSAGTLTLSHNGLTSQSNQAVSAGAGSFTFQTLSLSNANDVSFGTSAGPAITASVVPAGRYLNYELHDGQLSTGQLGIGTLALQPVNLPYLLHDRVGLHMVWSNNAGSTGTATVAFSAALYTRNSDSLSLASSAGTSLSVSFAGTASDLNGHRLFTIPWTNTIRPGDYYIGVISSTASNAGGANGSASQMVYQQLNSQFSGILGGASGGTVQMQLGMGHYSASTGAFPSAIAFSEILGRSSAMHQLPALQFLSQSV